MELHDSLGNLVPEDAFIIRATEFGQYINCPRNWMFGSSNGFNLEPKVRPQKLRFGLVWHKGLEELYLGNDPFAGLEQEFQKEEELIYGVGAFDPDIRDEIDKEKELARMMMEGYLQWRNNGATPPDDSFTVKAVERRVLVPIDEGLYIAVRTDTDVLDKSGGLWVLENKTRGKSSSVDNPPELQLDLQMGIQMLAVKETNPEPVRGAIYNLARKQAPSARVKAPLFGRHQVFRSQHELDVLKETLKARATEMIRDSRFIAEHPGEALELIRYNPQGMGLCQWGCSVKEICEAINRKEDVGYLVEASLKPREKSMWEMLAEELSE